MSKRPTPETESIKYHGTDETDAMVELWESCHLPADFARRMEAERNEARRLADTRLDQLEAITSSEPKDYLGLVYACKSHRKHIAQLIKERDEAREERDILRLNSLGTIQLNIPVTTDLGYDKLADTPKTDAYQYADYILNHYDRNSHMDKLCLAKSLVENGYGSKAAEIEALSEKEKAIRERDEAREALADWENAAAHVEADHPDEKHCGCVPVLRKLLADSKRERDEARESAAKWEAVALREASINGARICAKEDAK